MKDEFVLLRLAILLSAGALVFAVVIRTCQEAAVQRAQLESPSELLPNGAARIGCTGVKTIFQWNGDSEALPADATLGPSSPLN